MLLEENLPTIDGWEREKFGDHICEWVRELNDNERIEPDWEKYVLVIQEFEDRYEITINVAFENKSPGDLLSADFYRATKTIEEASAVSKEFVQEIESQYVQS